jgi:hypothetical protein
MDDEVAEKILENSSAEEHGAKGVLAQYLDKIEPLLDEEMDRGPEAGHEAKIEELHVFVDESGEVCCKALFRGALPRATSGGA